MRQAFVDLPVELEEACLMDGANHHYFSKIALPLCAPALSATALIIFASTRNELLFSLVIGGSKTLSPSRCSFLVRRSHEESSSGS